MIDWQQILDRYGPVVWSTAYRILHDRQDALDCYQETFLAAMAAAQRHPVTNWPGLLKCLATARGIDLLRQRIARTKRTDSSAELFQVPAASPKPGDQLQANELMDRVRQGLTQMPPQEAQVFWLRCIDELSYEEIAQHLDLTVSHVGVLLHRARARLRKILTEKKVDGRPGIEASR